jgi:hypothetical protein
LHKGNTNSQNEVIIYGTRDIFEREIDSFDIDTSMRHCDKCHFQHLPARLAKLNVTMEGRNANVRLERELGGNFHGFSGSVDLSIASTGNCADYPPLAGQKLSNSPTNCGKFSKTNSKRQ